MPVAGASLLMCLTRQCTLYTMYTSGTITIPSFPLVLGQYLAWSRTQNKVFQNTVLRTSVQPQFLQCRHTKKGVLPPTSCKKGVCGGVLLPSSSKNYEKAPLVWKHLLLHTLYGQTYVNNLALNIPFQTCRHYYWFVPFCCCNNLRCSGQARFWSMAEGTLATGEQGVLFTTEVWWGLGWSMHSSSS